MKRISNFKFKISNLKGFTLIELLVAIGLFSGLATLIISVLFVSLRTSKKSETIIALRQSGNAALLQMVNNIKFARSLDIPAACVPDATEDFANMDSITVTAFDGGQTVYGCQGDTISSNSAALLDVNSVKVGPCSFTCSQVSTSDPPTITIKFTLSPESSTDFSGDSTSIPFQSTVTMRNYRR